MTVIAHKKRDTENYRFFMGRKISRRIAHTLAVFIYCVASTAAAVDSDTWHYGMDNVGNITSRGTDPAPTNATHTYNYDGLYRLTDETNPNNTDQYDYDPNGNRTSFTRDGSSTTYQIDSNSNRLDQVGSDPRTYDNTGNTKTDRNGTRVFTYNKAGRLSQVHENSVLLATYTYNAHGQRSIKTTPSGTTYYMYDTSGQLLGEYDGAGQPIKEYVHLNSEPIAQLENSKTTYLHTDHLATARMATDEAGKVTWKWDSEAFGNKAPVTNNGASINLRFPGQYYDEETGLYYNYFRYYDPSTGRYITSDPIGLEGGLNTYAYVGGNPLRYTDPYGLLACGGVCTVGAIYTLYKACKWTMFIVTAVYAGGYLSEKIAEGDTGECEGDSCPTDGDSDGDDSDENSDRNQGDRWRSDHDAQDQFEDIEREQRRRRGHGDNTSIDSIEKSRQRARDALKPHNVDW